VISNETFHNLQKTIPKRISNQSPNHVEANSVIQRTSSNRTLSHNGGHWSHENTYVSCLRDDFNRDEQLKDDGDDGVSELNNAPDGDADEDLQVLEHPGHWERAAGEQEATDGGGGDGVEGGGREDARGVGGGHYDGTEEGDQ